MSTERILVHSSIVHEFQDALVQTIDQNFGSPENTPVIITGQSAKRNRALIQDAVSKGAKPLDVFNNKTGHHENIETKMRPVVLTNVNKSMDLFGGEAFGPSVSLYSFETEEEALELGNDTEYGLAASIFTEDLGAAFRVAEALDSGAVHINSMTVHDEFALPHGGVKKSGFGRFNGYQGLDEFLYTKSVTWMET